MLNGQTILVVEEEFLIALDIQRMLEDLGAGQLLFARSAPEAHELAPHWPSIGLAIVEVRANCRQLSDLVRRLREAGIAVALNTADGALVNGHPEFPGIPVVVKPMSEQDLVFGISRALDRHPRMSDCGS